MFVYAHNAPPRKSIGQVMKWVKAQISEKMKRAEINYQNLITLLRWNAWAIHRSWSLIFTIEKLNCTSALHVFDIETFNLFQNEQKVTQLLLRANWCRTIKVCASFDLSAIERTRQIKLLLIRVFVDCFYVEISLKQNAPKQVKRFDYLSLFTPPPTVFVVASLLQKVNC